LMKQGLFVEDLPLSKIMLHFPHVTSEEWAKNGLKFKESDLKKFNLNERSDLVQFKIEDLSRINMDKDFSRSQPPEIENGEKANVWRIGCLFV
jgi:hypothetical protein